MFFHMWTFLEQERTRQVLLLKCNLANGNLFLCNKRHGLITGPHSSTEGPLNAPCFGMIIPSLHGFTKDAQ